MEGYQCEQCRRPINSGHVMVAYYDGRRILLHDSGDTSPEASCSENFTWQHNAELVNGVTIPFPRLEEVLKKMPEPVVRP